MKSITKKQAKKDFLELIKNQASAFNDKKLMDERFKIYLTFLKRNFNVKD